MKSKLKIEYLPVGQLQPNPWNPNRVSAEMESRLKESIGTLDVYKPIIARRLESGAIEILGGEHRWKLLRQSGAETVPTVVLEGIDDKRAKIICLSDNGQYGQDDALMLSQVLRDIGGDDVHNLLPYSESDLAGIFSASEIDLGAIGFSDHELGDMDEPIEETVRKTQTHDLMRFKVAIRDRENVQKFIDGIIATRGYSGESDSLVAAGMALVETINLAKEAQQ